MPKTAPWEFHPDLSAERLAEVAMLITEGRHAALERHDEEAGDNGWTLGCSAFQFGRARILREADGDRLHWLGVLDRSLQLIFTIGTVPVRFYHGEADEPTDGTLRRSYGELRQLSLGFPDEDDGRLLAYRFAVETHFDGGVSAVKFVALRGETVALCWDVPLDGAAASGGVGRPGAEAVDLPPPEVGVRRRRSDDAETA